MSAPYEVTVAVAGYSWTVTDLDPATLGPTAPLTMGQRLPEDQLWPSQPLPMTATFGLVAATAAELADVVEGADVHLTYTAPPNPDPLTFDGNVTDVAVTPALFTHPDTGLSVAGVRVTVTAVGYLAQLWEETITVDEPETGAGTFGEDRLWNLFEATPWPTPAYPAWVNLFGPTGHKVLHVDGEALGPHLDRLLRVWLWDGGTPDLPLSRLIVVPNLDPATRELDAAQPWRLELVTPGVTLTPAGELAPTPTGWGVVVDASSADATDATIDAGRVDRDVTFVQRKHTNVTTVVLGYHSHVDNKDHSVSVSNGDKPTVRHTIDGDVDIINNSEVSAWVSKVAAFYLPAAGADRWGVDTVQWALYADTPGRLPPPLGTLVTFGPVPETVNPNARGWVTGLIRSWQLTVGPPATVELEVATAHGITDASADRMTWAEVPATPTWADLRPDHTWEDYNLLGGPA